MSADLRDRLFAALGFLVRWTVYASLLLPAAIVVAASLTPGDILRFPPPGISLRWYRAVWESDLFMNSLGLSFRLAALATLVSLVLGFAAAYAVDRYRFRGLGLVRSFLLSPLLVPTVVLGLGLMQFLVWIGLGQTFLGLLAGHLVITLPYVVRTLSASMVLFDRNLEQAAMSLRAPPLTVLRTITLPLLFPGIISAMVFAFVTSFGNVTLSVFLNYDGEVTLPVQVLSYVEQNYDPLVAAVSSVVILVTVLAIFIADRISGAKSVI
ncbi:ABC transporter permease [Siccirubricoccus sp. KC 17139]|uniref:ABC transporter permease n=1 Tax=Siccirubricoccus soli TaxID=2899147 RepID=A0ABT1DD23_9PROT|nr:ABC transporter permease [Siccirubricoccus soli]MCO6419831.1 ABC transporter permease [Siccirubricoccus soli]MCP2685966.1 ABC transporter permease [Siccirubricoccus soli]